MSTLSPLSLSLFDSAFSFFSSPVSFPSPFPSSFVSRYLLSATIYIYTFTRVAWFIARGRLEFCDSFDGRLIREELVLRGGEILHVASQQQFGKLDQRRRREKEIETNNNKKK